MWQFLQYKPGAEVAENPPFQLGRPGIPGNPARHVARILIRCAEKSMIRLTRDERAVLLDKVPDLANLAAGTAVFGQLLRDEPFSLALASGGFALWAALMTITFIVARIDR